MRVHPISTLMRYATYKSGCRTRTERQRSQMYVENYERRCTDPWMLPNDGESVAPRSWRQEDYPEARVLYTVSSMMACRLTSWCAVTIFHSGRREARKHTLSLLQGAHDLGKVVTFGPESSRSRTVSFLGRTLTLRQWRTKYEPDQQHVVRALKALGLTDARSGHSRNR